MKLLVLLTKRQPPSSRVRIVNCLDDWRAAGVEPTVMPIPSGVAGRLELIRQAGLHDVVLIQKKTSFHPLELKRLRARNPNIIFDYDDAVMFHELEHHKPLVGKHFRKFVRTIDHCAAVVAGNRFLARFAEANCPRVHVLPSPIDLQRYRLRDWEMPRDEIVMGWLGVSGNLHYLQALAPVFRRLCERFPNLILKIVSNEFIDMEGVRIQKEKWSLEREPELLASFDVGLMPLKDDLWSWGKCGYKILQYFAAGVPAVASPVGINIDFVLPGKTGYLASDHDGWERALITLLTELSHRMECGLAGREMVKEKYSQEQYSSLYCGIIKNAATP